MKFNLTKQHKALVGRLNRLVYQEIKTKGIEDDTGGILTGLRLNALKEHGYVESILGQMSNGKTVPLHRLTYKGFWEKVD